MAMRNWDRRDVLGGMCGLAAAMALSGCGEKAPQEDMKLVRQLGLDLTEEEIIRARKLLDRHPAIDIHAHPGRFFIAGMESWDASMDGLLAEGTHAAKTIADMREGGLAAACFSVVGDMKSLAFTRTGLKAVHPFAAGEAWADYQRQSALFRDLLKQGQLHLVGAPGDIAEKRGESIGAILSAEGGDFLEGRIERLEEVYRDGLRAITIVHYRINEIGDIQTEPPKHGGLTPFGKELVRGMNELGMIIDLAHASLETTRQAVEISTKPVMLSHSHLSHKPTAHPRLLSEEHARLIADGGGVIGAWPAGIVQHDLNDFVEETLRLVEAVGAAHVALGTDMDVNYKPVFDTYRQLPLVVALLLKKGLSETEATKLLGGNFLRVFKAVTPSQDL